MKIEKSSNIKKLLVVHEGASDVEIRWLISREDGAENFAMRMFELQPGGHTPLHTHPHEHEVFIVQGQGTFVCEAKEHEFGPEHVIFVPGGLEHRFKNTGDSVLRFLCLIPMSAV
jgi:quercetin dioxygenase-like cupin family protein